MMDVFTIFILSFFVGGTAIFSAVKNDSSFNKVNCFGILAYSLVLVMIYRVVGLGGTLIDYDGLGAWLAILFIYCGVLFINGRKVKA